MPWRAYKKTDPRRPIVHLRVILGRRGAVLLLMGILWVMQAAFVPALVADSTNMPLLTLFPTARAIGWSVTGAMAIWFAWKKHDQLGFAALYIMACYRVLVYFISVLDYLDDHHGVASSPRAFPGLVTWLIITAMVMIVAGWTEPGDSKEE